MLWPFWAVLGFCLVVGIAFWWLSMSTGDGDDHEPPLLNTRGDDETWTS